MWGFCIFVFFLASEDYSIFSNFVEGFLVLNKYRAETETEPETKRNFRIVGVAENMKVG